MKVSVNTIRFLNQHYNSAGDPAPDGVDALVAKIGTQLGAVEEVIDFGAKYKDALIVRVVECQDHPNADRLHVCAIDDGGKTQNVNRDQNGHIQIVCGAPNVRAGILAVWLPPDSTVPATADTQDPFVLESRELRGVVSNGMLASPRELGIGDNHDVILEVGLDSDEQVLPGTRFAEAYHLDGDVVIDMENKMFTHRPDCFGYTGIAREIAGIAHQPYKSPQWYRMNADIAAVEADELPLKLYNELPDLVPRFTAIVLSDVAVKPSPVWLQLDLVRAGLRPINNVVDYTNWFMLETGQPLHAYDYDKVKKLSGDDQAVIVVRYPRAGEKLALLNGKELTPREEAIMIATDQQLIGVGGVMGGADTEVDQHTTRIILECANFDMYSVRRTSMAHGLFTDAVTRFTKGQSPLQNRAVAAKMVEELRRFAGAKIASNFIDDMHLPAEVLERGNLHPPVTVSAPFINERLGLDLPAEDMARLLTNVEFGVEIHGDHLTVTAPFWRTDVAIPEDVVEEVGRLYGYDHLPLVLPKRSIEPAPFNPSVTLKRSLRNLLAANGANEVLTYSFVHGNLLDNAGQDREQAFKLANALSPDLQYYRLSLIPSLLPLVHANAKAGHEEFALFEMGKVHGISVVDDEGLPRELPRLSLVFAASGKTANNYQGAPFYQARRYLQVVLQQHQGASVHLKPLAEADFGDHKMIEQMTKPFDPKHAAVIVQNDHIVGVVGEFNAKTAKAFKLPPYCAGFELFLSALKPEVATAYTPLPRFPKVEQDICLKVPVATTYQQVYDVVNNHLHDNRPDQSYHSLSPVDIYQREDDPAHKQITLRLTIASFERTLTDESVNILLNAAAQAAADSLQAVRV